MIGVVIRWDGMFEAARLLGGCRSTGSGASCNRSLGEAREAREAPSVAFAGREPGSLGRARACLAGLPARAPQGIGPVAGQGQAQGSQAEGGPSPPPGTTHFWNYHAAARFSHDRRHPHGDNYCRDWHHSRSHSRPPSPPARQHATSARLFPSGAVVTALALGGGLRAAGDAAGG